MFYRKPEEYVKDFVERIIRSVDPNAKIRSEVSVPGRMWVDYQYGSILIEAKAPGKRELRESEEQLLNYMEKSGYKLGLLIDIPTKEYYEEYPKPYEGPVGFNLYFKHMCIYKRLFTRERLGEAEKTLEISLKVLSEIFIAKYEPKPEVVLSKVKTILNNHRITLLNIVRNAPERVRVYKSMWERNLELIYGKEILKSIGGDLDVLFVELTIYTTILKILGSTILESAMGGGRYTILMELLEKGHEAVVKLFWRGEALVKFNINYLFDRDEYDWVFAPEVAKNLDVFFRDLGKELLEIDWSQPIATDLLKRVYQNIVGKELRRQLGEYYTPDWIAKIMLWRALQILVYGSLSASIVLPKDIDGEIVEFIDQYYKRYSKIPSFVDPTCGSFTFGVQYLTALTNWYYNKRPKIHPLDFIKMILESVVGIDLNPVAVITAKVNYLLQIHGLLLARKDHREYLEEEPMIPVYRIDLANLHVIDIKRRGQQTLTSICATTRGGVVLYIPISELGVDINKIKRLLADINVTLIRDEKHREEYLELTLPKKLFSGVSVARLHRALIALYMRGVQGFEEELKRKLAEDEKRSVEQLYRVIDVLEGAGVDLAWYSLLTNYVLAVLASESKFDLVLGNLPWVNISKYPENYRERLRIIARDLQVYPQPEAAMKLDISVVLFAVSARYLLKRGGVIALMIPTSIFRGLHGAAWRDFNRQGLKLIEVHDLEEIRPFENAENQPGIVFAQKVR